MFNVLLNWITVYQYSETNVVNFLFSLLRIKGLYMFRALLAYPQEALHKRHLVYCVSVMSVSRYQFRSETQNFVVVRLYVYVLYLLLFTVAFPEKPFVFCIFCRTLR
jgi:hypothetical protein